MSRTMAFIVCSGRSQPARASAGNRSPQWQRRAFIRLSVCVVASVLVPKAESQQHPNKLPTRDWQEEDLCYHCSGRGKQPCSLCEGTGLFSIDDSVVQQTLSCPNCAGQGSVRCPACIGLGLANTKGILRDGKYGRVVRDWGFLSVLKVAVMLTISVILLFFDRRKKRYAAHAA